MSIELINVNKSFGEPPINVLKNINLIIHDGDFVALTGKSGSGKSTLLYLLSSLDNPSSGELFIDGINLQKYTSEELHRFRNQKMGFVFQFHYLIAELSALENVLVPTMKTNQQIKYKERAEALLIQFDLKDKFHRKPRQLSGGEQQRVAIARSLIMQPKYLFADEPTGSLDTVNGEMVMKIIEDTHNTKNTTVVLVTHDPDFASMAKRQIRLVDGAIV